MKGSVRRAETRRDRVGLCVKDRSTRQYVRLVISQPSDASRGKTLRSKRARCVTLK